MVRDPSLRSRARTSRAYAISQTHRPHKQHLSAFGQDPTGMYVTHVVDALLVDRKAAKACTMTCMAQGTKRKVEIRKLAAGSLGRFEVSHSSSYMWRRAPLLCAFVGSSVRRNKGNDTSIGKTGH